MKQIETGTLDIRGSGKAWAVYRGDDRLTPFYSCSYTAAGAATRLEKSSRAQLRPCLCCQQPFPSEGPHNRMCRSCRQLAAGIA